MTSDLTPAARRALELAADLHRVDAATSQLDVLVDAARRRGRALDPALVDDLYDRLADLRDALAEE